MESTLTFSVLVNLNGAPTFFRFYFGVGYSRSVARKNVGKKTNYLQLIDSGLKLFTVHSALLLSFGDHFQFLPCTKIVISQLACDNRLDRDAYDMHKFINWSNNRQRFHRSQYWASTSLSSLSCHLTIGPYSMNFGS